MEDLELNPLYRALLTKFKRDFDIACRLSCLIAIPHSDTLVDVLIDQKFVRLHILVPSKLLKMHFNSLQTGDFDDFELIDSKRLICQRRAPKNGNNANKLVVANVLAEEFGYNSLSKEYKTLLIDRPLICEPNAATISQRRPFVLLKDFLLGGRAPSDATRRLRARLISFRQLNTHTDCLNYLECISKQLTISLQLDARRMLSNYIVLTQYLEDAAKRTRALADKYTNKFERHLFVEHNGSLDVCDTTIGRLVRVSVENLIAHLMHDKLFCAICELYTNEDKRLEEKCNLICKLNLSLCQLGAQEEFVHFSLNDTLLNELRHLGGLKSPIAIMSCLMRVVSLISESLSNSVKLSRLVGQVAMQSVAPVPICSDDLIATFVYCIPRARPNNLFSVVRYLVLFGASSTERDQAAYYLATLDTALEYMLRLNTATTTTTTITTSSSSTNQNDKRQQEDDDDDTRDAKSNASDQAYESISTLASSEF